MTPAAETGPKTIRLAFREIMGRLRSQKALPANELADLAKITMDDWKILNEFVASLRDGA